MSSILDIFTAKRQLKLHQQQQQQQYNHQQTANISRSYQNDNSLLTNNHLFTQQLTSSTTTSAIRINNKTKSIKNDSNDNLLSFLSSPIINQTNNQLVNDIITTSESEIKTRFLIFIEDQDGTRSNIFDSNKYFKSNNQQQQQQPTTPTSGNASAQQQENAKQLNSDMITRMVFGSFPMLVANNRTAIKVHSLKNSNKTMISNVFTFYNKNIRQNSTASKTIPSNCICNEINRKPSSRRQSTQLSINETLPLNSSLLLLTMNPNSKQIVNGVSKSIDIKNTKVARSSSTTANATPINNLSSSTSTMTSNAPLSPCSSVPATAYGSYTGIYKRLMRSLSNSLISGSNTTIPNSENDEDDDDLDYENEEKEIRENAQRSTTEDDKQRLLLNDESNISLSDFKQTKICDKCIENNCFPKYKVGIAVIFCLPKLSRQSSSTSIGSTSSSPLQSNHLSSPVTTPTSTTTTTPSTIHQANMSFDPLVLFPAINSPTSNSTIINLSNNNDNKTSSTINNCNGNKDAEFFFEFFFSHLPLIEYQFKELRENVMCFLPLYFTRNMVSNKTFHANQASNNRMIPIIKQPKSSLSIQTTNNQRQDAPSSSSFSCSYSSTCSSNHSSSFTNQNNNGNVNKQQINHLNFIRFMIKEYEEYEKKFNQLYSSKRLSNPAWITIINSRKNLATATLQLEQEKSTEELTNVYNNLINDFVYLNKIITNTSNNQQQAISKPNFTNNQNRLSTKPTSFISSLSSSLTKTLGLEEKSFLTLEAKGHSQMFLSKLLSTILKYHLSWVYTVLPSNDLTTSHQNVSSKLRKKQAKWTSLLEKTNPYNPLWAQLSDLHGAVSTEKPLRLVRTVVISKDKELCERVLFLLSYFIRCGNSNYYDIHQDCIDLDTLLFLKSTKNDDKQNNSSTKSSSHRKLNINLKTSSSKHLKTKPTSTNNSTTAFNITDLNHDPISQLNNVFSKSKASSVEASLSVPFVFSPTSLSTTFTSSPSPSSNSSNSSSSSASASSSLNTNATNQNNGKNTKLYVIYDDDPASLQSTNSDQEIKSQNTAKELPLIGCHLKPNYSKSIRIQDNFAYSLLASYCERFVFEYVLHGTSDRSFLNDLHKRLVFSKRNSILDCKIDESVYIVVDLDCLDINVYSSNHVEPKQVDAPIKMVDSMVKSVLDMIKLFQNSEFVLLHLEDKLQEFYSKSLTLYQLRGSTSSTSAPLDDKALMNLMDIQDIEELDFLKRILSAVLIPPNLF